MSLARQSNVNLETSASDLTESSPSEPNKKKTRNKHKSTLTVGPYSLDTQNILGKGGFATVYKGLNATDGKFVAVKAIDIKDCPATALKNVMAEIDLMKKLNHKHIVQYLDHRLVKGKHLYIIIEYIENGSLLDLIKKFQLTEELVARYVCQVLEGLQYLHEQGVIHHDIKAANLLLTKNSVVKVADFGVAAQLTEANETKEEEDEPVGTPYWMAPEVITNERPTQKSDIWSLGCTVIELLTGDPPYYELNQMQASYNMVEDTHPPLPEKISKLCEDFLLLCFKRDPLMRKDANFLLNHAWVKPFRESYSKSTDSQEQQDQEPQPKLKNSLEFEEEQIQDSPIDSKKEIKTPLLSIKSKDKLLSETPPGSPQVTFPEGTFKKGVDKNIKSIKHKAALTFGSGEKSIKIIEQFQDDDDDEKISIGSIEAQRKTSEPSDLFKLNEETEKQVNVNQIKDTRFNNILNESSGNLNKYKDEEDDNYDTLFKKLGFGDTLRIKLDRFKNAKDDYVDDQTESTIQQAFEKIASEETNEDKYQLLEKKILSNLQLLSPEQSGEMVSNACNTLIEIFKQYPNLKSILTTHNSVLAIMELLESANENVIFSILQVVNEIILDNPVFQETLCLIGVLPTIMKFASLDYSKQIRKEAAVFINELTHTSPLTLQMFIACRGLPVLVEFLEHQESEFLELESAIFTGIDGLVQVFNIPLSQTRTPKNDFCRIFTKNKIMHPLSKVLTNLTKNKIKLPSKNEEYLQKVLTIILLFSEADSIVKQHLAELVVLKAFLDAIPLLKSSHKVVMLRTLKNLSLDTTTLESLETAGSIPVLVQNLGNSTKTINHQALNTLFSLCKINKKRQEMAAIAGAIPFLQKFINNNSSLQNLARDIICDMAQASRATRKEMWKHNGIAFYIQLLEDNKYKSVVFESICTWLADEPKAVQDEMMKTQNLKNLITIFEEMNERVLISILLPLQKLLDLAPKLNNAIGMSVFIHVLVKTIELSSVAKDAVVIMNLLKIVSVLYKYTSQPKRMAGYMRLYNVLKKLADDHNSILVSETSKQLLKAFDANMKL